MATIGKPFINTMEIPPTHGRYIKNLKKWRWLKDDKVF